MVKPGRHRQADAAHLGEVRALAAEQRLHRSVAVGLAAEEVDVLARLRCAASLPCGFVAASAVFASLPSAHCGCWLRGRLRACELLRHVDCLLRLRNNFRNIRESQNRGRADPPSASAARVRSRASSAITNTSVKNRSTAGRRPAISVNASPVVAPRPRPLRSAAGARRAPSSSASSAGSVSARAIERVASPTSTLLARCS